MAQGPSQAFSAQQPFLCMNLFSFPHTIDSHTPFAAPLMAFFCHGTPAAERSSTNFFFCSKLLFSPDALSSFHLFFTFRPVLSLHFGHQLLGRLSG